MNSEQKSSPDFNNDELSATLDDQVTAISMRENNYIYEIVSTIKALVTYLSDKNVNWHKKSIILTEIAYFLKPKDSFQNWNEFFDFLEGAGAVKWLVQYLTKELEKYY